jgi:hypothetical protein
LEQPTLQPQQLGTLLNELTDLRARNKALEKRVQLLEARIEQRYEITVTDYQKLLPYLESMRAKVLQLFFSVPPATGLTHQMIQEEFKLRFPMIKTVDLPRRTRELVKEGKLYSRQEEDGTKFYLKLLPDTDDKKNEHAETTNQKSPEDNRDI